MRLRPRPARTPRTPATSRSARRRCDSRWRRRTRANHSLVTAKGSMANGLTFTSAPGSRRPAAMGSHPSPSRKRPPGSRTTRDGPLRLRARGSRRRATSAAGQARRAVTLRSEAAARSLVGDVLADARAMPTGRRPSCRPAWCRARANSRSCPWRGSPRARRARRSWRPGPCAPARRRPRDRRPCAAPPRSPRPARDSRRPAPRSRVS